MRRFLLIACAALLAAGIAVTAAPAATTSQFHVTLCPPGPVVPNPRPDGGGGLHQRSLVVTADMDEGQGCGGSSIGSVTYSENFNLWPDGSSTAWCSFTSNVTGYGSFDGHCAGDLNEGSLTAHGDSGSQLRGIYVLDENGAYELFFAIATR